MPCSRLLVACLMLVAAGCVPTRSGGTVATTLPGKTTRSATPGSFELRFPGAVHGLELIHREDYPDPRLGTHLRYGKQKGLFADAYIYPAPPAITACGAACADSAVQAELAEFVGDIPEFISRGYYRSMTVASESPLSPGSATTPPGGGAPWLAARHMVLAVTRAAGPARSDYYLYLARGYKVKVRATYAEDATASAAIASFADELVRFVASSRGSTPSRQAVAPDERLGPS